MNEWNTEHYGDACVVKVPVSLGRDANSFNINLWNGRWQTRWTQSVSLRTVTYLIKVEAHLEAIGSVFFKYWVAGEPDFQVPRVHYYSSISSLTVTCLIACVCVCVCVCVCMCVCVCVVNACGTTLNNGAEQLNTPRQRDSDAFHQPLQAEHPQQRSSHSTSLLCSPFPLFLFPGLTASPYNQFPKKRPAGRPCSLSVLSGDPAENNIPLSPRCLALSDLSIQLQAWVILCKSLPSLLSYPLVQPGFQSSDHSGIKYEIWGYRSWLKDSFRPWCHGC